MIHTYTPILTYLPSSHRIGVGLPDADEATSLEAQALADKIIGASLGELDEREYANLKRAANKTYLTEVKGSLQVAFAEIASKSGRVKTICAQT